MDKEPDLAVTCYGKVKPLNNEIGKIRQSQRWGL